MEHCPNCPTPDPDRPRHYKFGERWVCPQCGRVWVCEVDVSGDPYFYPEDK